MATTVVKLRWRSMVPKVIAALGEDGSSSLQWVLGLEAGSRRSARAATSGKASSVAQGLKGQAGSARGLPSRELREWWFGGQRKIWCSDEVTRDELRGYCFFCRDSGHWSSLKALVAWQRCWWQGNWELRSGTGVGTRALLDHGCGRWGSRQ